MTTQRYHDAQLITLLGEKAETPWQYASRPPPLGSFRSGGVRCALVARAKCGFARLRALRGNCTIPPESEA